MCKTAVVLIIGLLLGCSGSDKPLAPTVPGSLIGEYSGTISYWRFKGTDSVVTASFEIEFSFKSDTAYYYLLPNFGSCSYGGTEYEYENGQLNLRSTLPYLAICPLGPIELLVGEFRVSGTKSSILLYQELPEFDFVRQVELNRVSQ
ncbi:MAG: hypothetical protein IIC66_05135 [candidate division Zixibacteria bacterium]|nr:hypothetical protein [candidate division Zixibacteria bacterium]